MTKEKYGKDKAKKSSANVFNASAVPNSDEELMKVHFAAVIRDIVIESELKEDRTSGTLNISKSEAAALIKGKSPDFSLNCLLSLLGKLGIDIEFVAREIPPGEPPKGLHISTSF